MPFGSFSSKGSFVRSNITFDTREVEINEISDKVAVYVRVSGDVMAFVENPEAVIKKLEDQHEETRVGDLEERKQHLLKRLQENSSTRLTPADGKR